MPNLILYYYIVTVIAYLTRDFVCTIYYYGHNYRLRHGPLSAPTRTRFEPTKSGKQDECTSLYLITYIIRETCTVYTKLEALLFLKHRLENNIVIIIIKYY